MLQPRVLLRLGEIKRWNSTEFVKMMDLVARDPLQGQG